MLQLIAHNPNATMPKPLSQNIRSTTIAQHSPSENKIKTQREMLMLLLSVKQVKIFLFKCPTKTSTIHFVALFPMNLFLKLGPYRCTGYSFLTSRSP